MRIFKPVALGVISVFFAGCSLLGGVGLGSWSGPRQELPVPLEITLMVAKGANPAVDGRPSPVVLTIFELSGISAFQTVDFFTLQQTDGSSLAGEFVAAEQHILLPGEVKVIRRKADLRSRFIGVTAGFRDLENSTWRASAALPPPYLAGRAITSGSSPQKKLYVLVTENSVRVRETLEVKQP